MRDYAEILKSMRICLNVDRDSNCLSECFGCNYISHDNHVMDMVRDAAETIEELESAMPKWISVKERLPESGKVVLSYFEHPYWGSVIHTGFFTDDGDFMHDVMKSMKRHKCMPTHWMPLPAPPEERSENDGTF